MFPRGTFAQYALIKASEKRLAKKPPNLEYERAAAIPESALTARTMVRASGLRSGQIALVIGATGGVGHFVLQLGKMEGARVVATGKADDAAYLRDLGADETVDYAAGDVAEQVRRRYPDGIDAVFDVVDSGDALLEVATVLRTPGTLISTLSGPAQDAFPQGISVHYVQLSAQEGDLDDLVRRAADGSLRVEIGGVYDLAQAGQALADLSDRTKHTKGKLVVRIP
jgi:NADPH:quinone reductase-like Zn-dependent oxidoreductase